MFIASSVSSVSCSSAVHSRRSAAAAAVRPRSPAVEVWKPVSVDIHTLYLRHHKWAWGEISTCKIYTDGGFSCSMIDII